MPTFPGCEGLGRNEARECSKEKLAAFLAPSIRKLAVDSLSNIEILLQFTVETDGSIKEVNLLKGDIKYEQSILKAMETAPKWASGKQRGIPARVQLRMPLKINLE